MIRQVVIEGNQLANSTRTLGSLMASMKLATFFWASCSFLFFFPGETFCEDNVISQRAANQLNEAIEKFEEFDSAGTFRVVGVHSPGE